MKIASFGETLLRIDNDGNGQGEIYNVGTGLNLLSNLRELSNLELNLVTGMGTKKDSNDLVKDLRSKDILFNGSYTSETKNLGSYILYKKPVLSGWEVVYNRTDTAWTDFIDNIQTDTIINILKDSKIVHFDGITLCVSKKSREMTLELMKGLKDEGVEIAFDYNFRKTLVSEDNFEEIREGYSTAISYSSYLTISSYDMNRVLGNEVVGEFPLPEFYSKYPNIKYTYGYNKVTHDERWELQPFIIKGSVLALGEKYDYVPKDMLGQGDAFTACILNDIAHNVEPDIEHAAQWSILKTMFVGDSTAPTIKEFESWKNKNAIIR